MPAKLNEVEWRSSLEDRVTRSNAVATLLDRYQATDPRPDRNLELAAMAILCEELKGLEDLVSGEPEAFVAPPGSRMAKLEAQLQKGRAVR